MTMQDFRRMAAEMDQRARQLMSENVTGRELIHRMVGHMPDLQKIWVTANDRQLAILCQDYPGFYQYASLMEEGAEMERANPRQNYQDFPELNDSLKQSFAAVLTDAATLERGYQAVIDAANQPRIGSLINELDQRHHDWLGDCKNLVLALKAADLPKTVLEMIDPAIKEMADRIAQLKKRAVAG